MFNFISKQKQDESAHTIHELVGCFGKLPLHADFIKYNLKVREAVELDEWVQDGITLLNRRYEDKWKKAFHLSPNYRFVFSGNAEKKMISGIISPSSDKTGRDYPFVLFRASDHEFKNISHSGIPLAYKKLYSEYDHYVKNNWSELNTEMVVENINKNPEYHAVIEDDDLLVNINEFLSTVTLGKLWKDLLPGANNENRELFINILVEILQTVARRSPQRVPWGIRLPLPSTSDINHYVMFFVYLVEQYLVERSMRLHFIWNEGVPGVPPRLMIFFRPIPASYYTLLIHPRRTEDMISDVLSEMEMQDPILLENTSLNLYEDMTLQELVEHIKQPAGIV